MPISPNSAASQPTDLPMPPHAGQRPPWTTSDTGDLWMVRAVDYPVGLPQPTTYLHLTAKDHALLAILTTGAGEPVSEEDLRSKLYPDGNASKNVVQVRVHKLRRKLKLFTGVRIDTILNQGYVLNYIDRPSK